MTAGAWGDGAADSSGKGAPLPLYKDRMARRKFFADGAKLRAFNFEPGLVYGAFLPVWMRDGGGGWLQSCLGGC